MSKKDVAARLASARKSADAASARLAHLSQKRLAELLQLAPAARLSHIDDPTLQPADRAALRRSLTACLPRVRRIPFPRFQGKQVRRWKAGLVRFLLTLEITIPIALVPAWFAIAWHQTAYVATFTRDLWVDFRGSDGTLFQGVLAAGRSAVVRSDIIGPPKLRRWVPGLGYDLVALPSDALKWGRPEDRKRLP